MAVVNIKTKKLCLLTQFSGWFWVISPFVSSFKLGSFAGPVIQANESSVVIFSIVVDFIVVTIGCSTVGVVDIVVLLVVGVDDVTVVVVVVLLVVDVTVVVLVVVSDVVDGFSVLVTEIVDDGFGLLTGVRNIWVFSPLVPSK